MDDVKKIVIDFDSDTYSTGGYDPEDEWSRDSTSTTWTAPSYCKIIKGDERHYVSDTELVPASVQVGDTIFMVWVQYSTGDSFGYDSGYSHEIIGLYKDSKLANQAAEAIREDNRDKPDYSFNDGGNQVMVPTFDGTSERPQRTGGWKGYFEGLDFVEVSSLTVR